MSSKPSLATIQYILTRGVAEVIVREHLERDLKKGAPLRLKLGMDPTASDLHLGHAVVLRKLREFQELGHQVVFIVGDATARIGDPSGKSKTRSPLSDEQIEANAQTYFDQVGRLLDMKNVEIHRNSEWLDKFTPADFLKLAASFSVHRVLERDDFSKRLKTGADFSVHELLYPAMQAYDSIAIRAAVEFGGTDQKFNLLAGRDLQRKMGMPEQDVVTCPLLIGLDGKQKMSKSLGNYIGIIESPDEMFGKVMTIPDALIVHYFELATEVSLKNILDVKRALKEGENPRNIKARLAREVVTLYHNGKAAREAAAKFDLIFRQKRLPARSEMPMKLIKPGRRITLKELLVEIGLVSSKTEAHRVIVDGAVTVDGNKEKDPNKIFSTSHNHTVLKGKRHYLWVHPDA